MWPTNRYLNLFIQCRPWSVCSYTLSRIQQFSSKHHCKSLSKNMENLDWLIGWGLTPFLTLSQSYHSGQLIYSCISWFSHTSTPHNNLSKQLAAFPHRLSPLVEDEWRMSHRLLSNVGKKAGRAGIQTHNPWIMTARIATDWATGARRKISTNESKIID